MSVNESNIHFTSPSTTRYPSKTPSQSPSINKDTQKEIFQKLKEQAAKNPEGAIQASNSIHLIENEHKRYKIGKIAAKAGVISEFVQNYQIQDPTLRYKLAKIAVENGTDISAVIKNYDLTEDQRFAISEMIVAKKDKTLLKNFLQNLENFHLNPNQLDEIIKKAAAKDLKAVIDHINKYNFTPAQLFGIARIGAKKNSYVCLTDFKRIVGTFKLTSEQSFEVLKIVASHQQLGVAQKIKSFNLDSDQRAEIAKIIAQKQPLAFLQYLAQFKLNQDQRFEIAKIAASHNGEILSAFIDQFKLDLNQRFEVALIAAQNGGVSKSIRKYHIDNHQWLYQLAELEIQSEENPAKAPKIIKKFVPLLTETECQRILLQANLLAGTSLLENGYATTENQNWMNLMQKIDQLDLSDKVSLPEKLTALQEIFKQEIIKTWGKDSEIAQKLLPWVETYSMQENPFLRQKQLSWMINVCVLCQLGAAPSIAETSHPQFTEISKGELSDEEISEDEVSESEEEISENEVELQEISSLETAHLYESKSVTKEEMDFLIPILQNLSILPDPVLRGKITYQLMQNYLGEDKTELRERCIQLANTHPGDQGTILAMLLAPIDIVSEHHFGNHFLKCFYSNKMSLTGKSQRTVMDLLFNLQRKKFDGQEQEAFLKGLIEDLPSETTKTSIPQGLSKDARQEALRMQQEAQKQQNLAFAQMLNCAQLATDLLLLDKTEILKEAHSRQDIMSSMEKTYQDVLGNTKIENFIQKYLDSFAAFRNKSAFLTYYTNLLTLNPSTKAETLPYIQLFAQSVLEGTFYDTRYQETEHLQTIFKARPDLKEAWLKEEVASVEELEGGTISEIKELPSSERMLSEFKTKILTDKHLGNDVEAEYPELFLFLNRPEDRSFILSTIDTARKEELRKLKTKERESRLQTLRFEKCLLDLFAPEIDLTKRLEEAKRSAPETSEFKHDLDGMIKMATQPKSVKQTAEDMQVVITDHPSEFILVGEEILKSCQRISGDPQKNRGILGYALNGQTKIIAAKKNKYGPKIARAVLRLLWDEKAATPLLYLEPIYTVKEDDAKEKNLIIQMAVRYANRHQMPLLTKIEGLTGETYPNEIRSLKSLCPFEYVDALKKGEVTSSSYAIQDCIRIA